MKKIIAVALMPLIAGCATNCHKHGCQKAPEPAPIVYEEPVEEINPCGCVNEVAPCREVLHPRIVEEVPAIEPKRPCDDHQFLDCGCGGCDTFHPYLPQVRETPEFYQIEEPAKSTYVPAQPEAYRLAANRLFNRFIKDTYKIYSKTPNLKVYVANPTVHQNDLPEGINEGAEVLKTQIENSHAFVLTTVPENADYILKTSAEWFDTESKEIPAIKYTATFVDKNGNILDGWTQIVKRADNKSWL